MIRASQERVRQIYTSTPFQYAIGLLITAVHAREARVTFVGPRSRRAYAIARTAPGALAGRIGASAGRGGPPSLTPRSGVRTRLDPLRVLGRARVQ